MITRAMGASLGESRWADYRTARGRLPLRSVAGRIVRPTFREPPVERFTISLDEELARAFDALIAARGYSNRSEAVRDILRAQIEASRLAREDAPHCIANLSYVFNHHERELAERVTHDQHDHHDLCVATLHAHLDHDNCMESVILRGRPPRCGLRRRADRQARRPSRRPQSRFGRARQPAPRPSSRALPAAELNPNG
jgi:CopG family nickel-responsive transcriptional regulator